MSDGERRLDLSRRRLGDVGAQLLALLLPCASTVASLDLSGNEIRPDGAKALADALTLGMASLTWLSVAFNGIIGDGAQQLASAVLAKPNIDIFSGIPLKELRADSLTTLNLSGRGLGVPEAIVLADLLRSVCSSLTSVSCRI